MGMENLSPFPYAIPMKSSQLNSLSLSFLLISCIINAGATKTTAVSSYVYVVFKKNPKANAAQLNQFYTKNYLTYYNENYIQIKQELKNKLKDDTLKIATANSFKPISLFHNYIYFNYLFKTGDTVVFSFGKDDIPSVTILNRTTTSWDKDFPVLVRKRFHKPLQGDGALVFQPKGVSMETRFNGWYADFLQQNLLIDSLVKEKALSIPLANYYRDENKAGLYRNISFREQSVFLIKIISKDTITAFANRADLLETDFFQSFLKHNYIWSNLINIEKIKLSQSVSLNYSMAYDKISTHFIQPVLKEYLLFYSLTKLKEEGSKSNYDVYLTKFKLICQNKAYLDILSSEAINNNLSLANDAIKITDSNGKQIEWNNFVKSAVGKVIYVDFWASWCMPCRAAMPASKKLKASYTNRPIVFAYLSLDIKKEEWIKAAIEENMGTDQNSFLLLNPKSSPLTQKLKLTTIPRYLIYSKSGKLVHTDAPAPDNPKLGELLDQYISAK
jgi:thiol-disulfide isomerase/thioredoxin